MGLALAVELVEAEYRARPSSYEFLARARVLAHATGQQFEPVHAGTFASGEFAPHCAATIANLRAWWKRSG